MKTLAFLITLAFLQLVAKADDNASVANKDQLKVAVTSMFGIECDVFSPREAKIVAARRKVFTDAGPAAVIDTLVDLLATQPNSFGPRFVGDAAAYAAKQPFSEPLRTALRSRRASLYPEYGPVGLLGVSRILLLMAMPAILRGWKAPLVARARLAAITLTI